MYKRLTLSLAMLAVGAAMLAASGIASTGSANAPQGSVAKKGGVLKVSLFAGIENIDPQRSYYVPESQYEWLTQRPLLNFAHAVGARGYRLLNEGAQSYTVSRDGRTYTFHIRKGMKFSNGQAVTAANYKHTLTRVLNPNVGSPLASFLTDPASVNIVGAIAYTIGVQQDQALLLVKKGSLDWPADGLPATAWGPIFQQYGTKGRARVFSTSVVDYATMNTSKGVFSNLSARKAVEYGLNRKSLVKIRGPRAGYAQCSLLTPAIPGYKKCTAYPLNKQDLTKARSLAKGHTGHINYWYTASTLGTLIQRLGASQLNAIGFSNIDTKPFQSGLFTALGKKGNDYDFALVGWSADFPDPYDYINKLLSGNTIQDVQNNNTAYFNNPTANKLMNAAARLRGGKRYSTYGKLDNTIMTKWAPIAGIDNRNDREFFSSRVDTKSVIQSPIYEIDLGKIALK